MRKLTAPLLPSLRALSLLALNLLALSVLVLNASTVSANPVSAATWDVSDLMHLLSQQKTRKATFVEKKYIATLEAPLESSGELSFTAPDRLEKRILEPKPEAVILDGDKLLIERSNGHKVKLALSDRPEVSAFVESIRATLMGDRAALEHFYALKLDGSADHWQLSLTPLQAQMLKVISQIRIVGTHEVIDTIEFLQADGDRSVMTITDDPVTAIKDDSAMTSKDKQSP